MDEPIPPAPLPTNMADRGQARPMIKAITQHLPKRIKARLMGPRKKITTGDIHIKERKIKYW